MDSVCPSDYSVDVGTGVCVIVSVTSSSLSCMPPEKEPEKAANSQDDGHPVIVSFTINNEMGGLIARNISKCTFVTSLHNMDYLQWISTGNGLDFFNIV